MRYAVIMAGGSGTRLWPMSRRKQPKQLIPFVNGKSLLEISYERFDGMIPADQRYICASELHRELIVEAIEGLSDTRYLGEPEGRDTLNAVGFSTAVLAQRDPEAIVGVFTADHIIEPVEEFQRVVQQGFELAEDSPHTLVTFGITPTGPSTGYGYLELGESIGPNALKVKEFKEKPSRSLAEEYFQKGPDRYLWNSGMFIWQARTLLGCIRKFEPTVADGLELIAETWDTSERENQLARIFPGLKKTSIDFGVMEPASNDSEIEVAAIPMPLRWLDVGSWTTFAKILSRDSSGNAIGAEKSLFQESANCIVASEDPGHLITAVGCEDLIVIHTEKATLVCRSDMAERVKEVQKTVREVFGEDYV